jgi:hypothetical protein
MADDECQMADDECQMADDECQMAGSEPKSPIPNPKSPRDVEAGGCDEGQSGEPMTEGSPGPVVGYDSDRVIDDSSNDKIGILSHEGGHATGQPGQGDGVGQCLPGDVTTPQNAPNKAAWFQKQVTPRGGWGRRPKGDAPRSEASALGARRLSPTRPQPPSSCHLRRC